MHARRQATVRVTSIANLAQDPRTCSTETDPGIMSVVDRKPDEDIPQENDRCTNTRELCCQHGVVQTTFYCWRRKYDGLQVNEARRLQPL